MAAWYLFSALVAAAASNFSCPRALELHLRGWKADL